MTSTIGTKISTAFVLAQKEMSNAKKDSTNPFFRNRYADLNAVREACLPALNKHGISVLQPTVQFEGKNFVKTILLHESGETIESLTEILFAKQNDPQAQGSGITYARRYGLQSLVNIGAEDDDGNKASEQPKNKPSVNKTLANIADDDMKEMMNNKNQKDFENLKTAIENCPDEEALKEIWTQKENIKIINSLKKWQPKLHDILVESKDLMKASFVETKK